LKPYRKLSQFALRALRSDATPVAHPEYEYGASARTIQRRVRGEAPTWFDVLSVEPQLGLVALVLVAAGVSRCQLAGLLRRVPRAGLSGVRTWRRAAAPGRRQEAAAKPRPPQVAAFPGNDARSGASLLGRLPAPSPGAYALSRHIGHGRPMGGGGRSPQRSCHSSAQAQAVHSCPWGTRGGRSRPGLVGFCGGSPGLRLAP
jgi:hypothetical protein